MTENPHPHPATIKASDPREGKWSAWNEGWNEAIKAVIKQAQAWGMPEHIAKVHFEAFLKKVD